MAQHTEPNDTPRAKLDGERRCPICGGVLIDIHCIARCTRCHTMIDSCCEGVRPAMPKPTVIERQPREVTEGRELKVDRSIYLVDDASRTYRFLRRNPDWQSLDDKENEENKRQLHGYARILREKERSTLTTNPQALDSVVPRAMIPPSE